MTTAATYRDGLPTNLAAAALDALAWLEFYQRQLADEAIADCELWEDRKRRLAMAIDALRVRVSVADLVHEEDVEALGLPLSANGTCGNVAC